MSPRQLHLRGDSAPYASGCVTNIAVLTVHFIIIALCLLSGITFADTLDVRKFTPIKLPATIPDVNHKTGSTGLFHKLEPLDTNWVKNVLSEDVVRHPNFPYYTYFPVSRFTVFDSILTIVVRKSGLLVVMKSTSTSIHLIETETALLNYIFRVHGQREWRGVIPMPV